MHQELHYVAPQETANRMGRAVLVSLGREALMISRISQNTCDFKNADEQKISLDMAIGTPLPHPQVCDLKNARGGDCYMQETETPGRHFTYPAMAMSSYSPSVRQVQLQTQGKQPTYDILETPQGQCSSSLPFQVGSGLSVHRIIPEGSLDPVLSVHLRRGTYTRDLAFCRGKVRCSSKPTSVQKTQRKKTKQGPVGKLPQV